MKIRNGFISNSSSSSFIVLFPKAPKTTEETKEIMFGDLELWKRHSTLEIAKTVYSDIVTTKAKFFEYVETPNDMLQLLLYGTEPGYQEMPYPNEIIKQLGLSINEDDWNKSIEKYKKELNEAAENLLNALLGTKSGRLYYFEYADDSTNWESFLEHGDIFHNLPHIVESHH